jgi:hypothetical protein
VRAGSWHLKIRPLRHGVIGMRRVRRLRRLQVLRRSWDLAQARRTVLAADRFEEHRHRYSHEVRGRLRRRHWYRMARGTGDALPQDKRLALIGRELLDSVTERFIARGFKPRA